MSAAVAQIDRMLDASLELRVTGDQGATSFVLGHHRALAVSSWSVASGPTAIAITLPTNQTRAEYRTEETAAGLC